MPAVVTLGNRRFVCLSPTLVRMEYAPRRQFNPRRSMVAYAAQKPKAFRKRAKEGDWTILDTGCLTIRTRENGQPFNRLNLEVRWTDGRVLQFWRPGDRDHQNLGGTLRSLDRYGGAGARLDGVHPAGMESPDPAATSWPAWLQCEEDPAYRELHPDPPEHFGRGNWLSDAQGGWHDGRYMERTYNWYVEARRFCPGVLSRSGYFFLNDSESAVLDEDDFPVERDTPGAQDWYFFGYGRDYKQGLADYRLLAGPAPLPTHKALGIMFSRWPAFTEAEAAELVERFRARGHPLSVLVMDMEWHKEGWGHWEFNPDLLPDPKRFFAWCHDQGLEVTFNDHPLDVREDDTHFAAYRKAAGRTVEVRRRDYNGKSLRMAKVDITEKRQNQAFCRTCHDEILKLGLDYWWNDGSRGQMIGTCGQLVASKTFFEEVDSPRKRGMYLGRYGGMGSHRYGAFFTGDTGVSWEVLALQVEFNIRAGHLGLNYISHDLGGFCCGKSMLRSLEDGTRLIPPVLYLRWLQFGVFNPVMRFHSAPGAGSRQPWDYDPEVGDACRHWLRVRHSLLPYIYTHARTHYETGMPLTRGLFLDEPDNPDAYRFDQYRFGPDLLVAPVVVAEGKRSLYLPAGRWWEFEGTRCLEGGMEIRRDVGLAEVPVYVRAGAILPRQDPDAPPHAGHVESLVLDVYPGASGDALLYEDDGKTNRYQKRGYCKTAFSLRERRGALEIRGRVEAGTPLGDMRNVVVQLPLSRAPQAVHLGRKPLPADAVAPTAPGWYRISVGPISAAKELRLRIVR